MKLALKCCFISCFKKKYKHPMNLTKNEAISSLREWLMAWNQHDLPKVMDYLHDNVVFENYTGAVIVSKIRLQIAWTPWFLNHGNFSFVEEDIFFDQDEQKMLLQWCLEWPSPEKSFLGKREIRRGADVLYFVDGKVIRKQSYSKTFIQIEKSTVCLKAAR